ncbi:hypothetical protein Vadar_033278 [Vaccinium darrowii]|uniref:Uncharacterized protein n=1 Tax=Vaccinium darrowii TaxID=229202 RepID=A0ACB7XLL7_9ERIC|nr:hypothetical protein Vadar_033278 [Vaccinium darrowii]
MAKLSWKPNTTTTASSSSNNLHSTTHDEPTTLSSSPAHVSNFSNRSTPTSSSPAPTASSLSSPSSPSYPAPPAQSPTLGRAVHCHTLVRGYGLDSFVQAVLVAFYAKCGDLRRARKVFDEMNDRTVVAWNSMISGYEQNGFSEEAIGLFHRMRDSGVEFDLATLVSVLAACAQAGALELGYWVHDWIRDSGFSINVVIDSSLINMYAKCGNVRKARKVFDSMTYRNIVSWTAMISGYGINGYGR